jgi:hypothetical protein
MKKAIFFVAVSAFVGFLGLGSIASADNVVPGSYEQQNSSGVMGVGQTMMQMGARDRALTNASNLASQAGVARNISGVNSDGKYRSQMNDNRIDPFGKAYMKENLVSDAQCAEYHPTLK